jgi:GNAT superfamily N-acetyltransferase
MAAPEQNRSDLTFEPVTPNEWDDLQLLFSESGVQRGCWCMWWRIKRADFGKQYGEANKRALREIIQSGTVPGILAYLKGRPIGWCSVAPREDFPVLDRSRTLKRIEDEPVWSIVCFFISKAHRNQGVSKALIEAAKQYARENGARIIEAYPLVPKDAKDAWPQRYTGILSTFEKAGFTEVIRRSKSRAIMRYIVTQSDG